MSALRYKPHESVPDSVLLPTQKDLSHVPPHPDRTRTTPPGESPATSQEHV